MKTHTSSFKEQIKLIGKEIDSRITFGDTVLGKNDLNAVTPSFQGGILKSVMKQLDIDSNVSIPVGTILNYKFGVKVNGEYEYLDFGNYVVKDVEKQEDTMSYKITCYDKLLFSMKDYAKMPITYPITIRSYINALCSFLGIRFANNNDTFVNYNKTIPTELYLDANGNSIGYTFRDVFDELAQVTASTICINENDEVEVRYINDTGDTIDEEYLKDVNVNFGEKFGKINSIVLSRSGESDNIYLRDETSVAENGLCELKIIDNQIMNFNNRDEFLPEILGKLNGLEYYLNDYSSTGIVYYDLCDRYNVQIGDNIYSCVMLNDEINITQGLEEKIYTEMPEETETDYTKADKTDRKINQTYLIVDKQNQQIQAVISQTDEQNQKIAQVTQTVEELNSKISDIADITTSAEDTDAKVEINEVNQSEPIRLVVRPIGENISYLYPSDNLYPSDDLFMKIRTIRFHNNTTDEDFDYELPDDLLYYDSENYDEFILDYDGQSCVINKKVGYNDDGTTYVLDKMTTISYEFPKIVLSDGDYTVSILSYDTGYIFARLMAKNIYTTQFYTKAEVDSEISQTAQNIELSVNGKFENYSTTTEMNSAIQLSASGITSSVSQTYATKNELKEAQSSIKQTTDAIELEVSEKVSTNELIDSINNSNEIINSSKISLTNKNIDLTTDNITINSNNFSVDKNGKITATSGDVGGFSLGKNKFEAKIYTDYNYTETDKTTVHNIIMNGTTPTATQLAKYDFNGDGKITASDYVTLSKILESGVSTTSNGLLTFNTNKAKSTIELYDGNGSRVTYIDLWGSLFDRLYANNASITNLTVDNFTNNSDERLKEDICVLDNKYQNLLKEINPVSFKYKNTGNEHIGFIAQEVIEALEKNNLPQIPIKKDELGFYSLNYLDFIGILWKSNQNLIARVEKLEEEIEVLKNEK